MAKLNNPAVWRRLSELNNGAVEMKVFAVGKRENELNNRAVEQ
jgi:hypothetical protein